MTDERTLGRTGARLLPVSLGGEGILRTTGRAKEAVPVILEALRLGVRYCDTAPAYQQSQDYYGEAFRSAGPGARDGVFLASKTHERTRDQRPAPARRFAAPPRHRPPRSLADARPAARPTSSTSLCRPGGALKRRARPRPTAAFASSASPGTTIPRILLEAMRRFPFDSVLVALNPADPRYRPFVPTVVAEARRQGIGVVGMKVLAAGPLLREASAAELIRYTASIADTVIVGCSTVDEVRANLAVAHAFTPMTEAERRALEQRIAPRADDYDTFKG